MIAGNKGSEKFTFPNHKIPNLKKILKFLNFLRETKLKLACSTFRLEPKVPKSRFKITQGSASFELLLC